MKIYPYKKTMAIITLTILLLTGIANCIGAQVEQSSNFLEYSEKTQIPMRKESQRLDNQFIYNITAALSNVIFDAYDEENGEIAKGRAFGTKGEHRAAEIIFENMSALGLQTTMEKLSDRPGIKNDFIDSKLEIISYKATLNNQDVECYIAPSWQGHQEDTDELNTTFNYSNLSIHPLPCFPTIINQKMIQENKDFVFIAKDKWNDPNAINPMLHILKSIIDPLKFYMLFHIKSLYLIKKFTAAWYRFYPKCKGFILYDFNEECHDFIYFPQNTYENSLPIIFINGSLGNKIIQNNTKYKLSFNLQQRYNTSVDSFNVIGKLYVSDTTKTIIVSCLYDSVWNQGTADSAIGMGLVLAIAKYFVENNIVPQYTIKFIAFSGEEYDLRGAFFHEALHKTEKIHTIIDLNQIGFTQKEPLLTLDITANKPRFLNQIYEIAKQGNYVNRTGNAGLRKVTWLSGLIPGNAGAFATNRPLCNAVCFFKDGGWTLHHRDGKKHTEGDVLKYFNWTDVNITGEIILNITKYCAINISPENTNIVSPAKIEIMEYISFVKKRLSYLIST